MSAGLRCLFAPWFLGNVGAVVLVPVPSPDTIVGGGAGRPPDRFAVPPALRAQLRAHVLSEDELVLILTTGLIAAGVIK